MLHLKPVSRANLVWFDQGPLEILRNLLAFISGIAPIVQAFLAAKQPPTS